MKKYLKSSWISDKIEVRTAGPKGRGLFAAEPIRRGEVVVIWGGNFFTEEDLKSGKSKNVPVAAIDEGIYIESDPHVICDAVDLMNHSCKPNVWMKDEVTLVAMRDIAAGEEVTADYAMWEPEEDWIGEWECACGSDGCRRKITGRDWRNKELQKRYKGHFTPLLNKRINRLKS